METSNIPVWKRAIVASAMAISGQTALANEPQPEPASSALVKNVKSLGNNILEKIGEENSDLALKVGVGSLGIGLLGVGLMLGVKRNRRADIKRQISEISELFKAGIAGYPESFIKHHAAKAQQMVSELEALSNKELDEIIKEGGYKLRLFERKIKDINATIGSKGDFRKGEKDTKGELQVKFDDIKNQGTAWGGAIATEVEKLQKERDKRKKEGFVFQEVELPVFQASFHAEEMRLSAEQVIRVIRKNLDEMNNMQTFFSTFPGMDVQIQKEWDTKNAELLKISPEYKRICGQENLTNWRDLEKQIRDFVKGFQIAFQAKDMKKLTEFSNLKNTIIALMRDDIIRLREDINWYKDVHTLIIQRQGFLETLKKHWSSIGENANKAIIIENVTSLYDILAAIRILHTEKQNIGIIKTEFERFDAIYSDTQGEMQGNSRPDQSISESSGYHDEKRDFQPTEPMQW